MQLLRIKCLFNFVTLIMYMKNLLLVLSLGCLCACNSLQQADLIVHHGKVYTVDSAFSMAEAFAIKDGKILAVGYNADILKTYSAKQVVNAQGKAVYPGLIDAHAHFLGYGQSLFAVNLYNSKSMDEMVQRIQQFVTTHPNEQWILGRGWDQNKFPGKAYPTNEQLNKFFPDKPVLLERVDGHASIANNKALQLAGIQPNQTITGGEFETKNNVLTGLLIDNAVGAVASFIPAATKADYEKWLLAAQENCFAQGLTTLTECGLNVKDINIIDTLQQENKLNARVFAMFSDNKENLDYYLSKGPYKTDKLYVHGVKVYADGALGSRGACLLQPYSDRKGWTGFLLHNKSHYDSLAAVLSKTEFQMCTHAIGDSANREILKIYARYLNGKNDKRWRIEHAQIINQNDFALFGNSSIIPSVQPTHGTSDMYWAEERLGKERLKGGYALQQLLQQNGWLPLGTDFPVEDISPFKTFLAAVFRRDADGFPADGFQAENALTREQTIRGMTIWAAKAAFLDKELGSLEAGKKADFIILNNDLMQIPEQQVLLTKPIATYLGGKKVFGK